MGKWRHRLSNKKEELKKADCAKCGKGIEIVKDGNIWKCIKAWRLRKYLPYKRPYRKKIVELKKIKCKVCGIINKDHRFFDIDHKDNNHKNNNFDNLIILCPNCHRIKTMKLWDSLKE